METFTCPIASLEEQPEFAVEDVEFDDTSRQRYIGSTVPKMAWNITTRHLTEGEMQAIRNFYMARYGGYVAFYWVCPTDGTAYTVTFAKGSFRVRDVDSFRWQITFTLRKA